MPSTDESKRLTVADDWEDDPTPEAVDQRAGAGHGGVTGDDPPQRQGQSISAIRYTDRLAELGITGSVSSGGDSFDNALAETVNGLFKTEPIKRRGPWRSVEQVELATLEWVDWWNHRRLHTALGGQSPAEYETAYHQDQQQPVLAGVTQTGLH